MQTSLVDRQIEAMVREGRIKDVSSGEDLMDHIQPASLDLPTGDEAWILKNKFLPLKSEIEEIIEENAIERMPLDDDGVVLYKGQTYLVPSIDVDLPEGYSASLSPKSSIGRIDLLTRGLFDRTGLYDKILRGKKGRLWLEYTPRSFNVRIRKGDTLSQMMIFPDEDSDESIEGRPLLYDEEGNPLNSGVYSRRENKILMHLDLSCNPTVGYRNRMTNEPIDLRRRDHDRSEFFEDTQGRKGKMTLEKDKFYILCTKEKVSIPLDLSGEMVPFSHRIGELRVHYAGFFDPGFGHGDHGEIKGTKGVLEVRPHETMTVYDGQPICLMEFYKNAEKPEKGYGKQRKSNYSVQEGPQLAKYFTP